MRILIAHNRYQTAGGEDAVVRDEIELLKDHGHSVELLEEDNDEIQGLRGKANATFSVFHSESARRRMKRALNAFQPEVVHVHNWFPLLSPSIFRAADAWGAPVLQTLHNYRMLCANSLLYREGSVCTDCVGKSFPLDGIIHGCYRGSRAGSAIVTAAYAFHRLAHTWDAVDLFLAVSEFQRELLVRGGLPAEKVVVKPNFVGSENWRGERDREDFALFAGRLSPEKGVRTMLSAWDAGKIPLRLKILGDGPMAGEVRACAAKNARVVYLGLQTSEEVYRQMARARFLLFPSEWYEGLSRTVIEAFAQGTPVLAADLGVVRELVEEGVTGYRYPAGNADALAARALRFPAGEKYQQMSLNCRKLFLGKFTAEANYRLLIDIYNRAIMARKTRRQRG